MSTRLQRAGGKRASAGRGDSVALRCSIRLGGRWLARSAGPRESNRPGRAGASGFPANLARRPPASSPGRNRARPGRGRGPGWRRPRRLVRRWREQVATTTRGMRALPDQPAQGIVAVGHAAGLTARLQSARRGVGVGGAETAGIRLVGQPATGGVAVTEACRNCACGAARPHVSRQRAACDRSAGLQPRPAG